MKTRYYFTVETFVKHTTELRFSTSTAEVVLVPDADQKKNQELTSAVVTVNGHFEWKTILLARYELTKVILRHTTRGGRIVDNPGLMPDRFEEIQSSPDEKRKPTAGVTAILTGRKLALHDQLGKGFLRINVDSNSPAIFSYYESMRKPNVVDRFREQFKIIEYFSGEKKRGEKARDKIVAKTGSSWWVPDEALEIAKGFTKDPMMDASRLAGVLCDLRDEASHMRRNYGLSPIDLPGQARIAEMFLVLDMIVRHSLERHPETGERTESAGKQD